MGASPATAQVAPPSLVPREGYPAIAPRGFAMFAQQRFAARETFDAIFGESVQPFRGGGVDVVLFRHFFAELVISRFEETGSRAFRAGTETFSLGIPLTATISPLEVTGGYRLTLWRHIVPYVGAGLGSYRYEETSSFSADGEDVDLRKRGTVLVAGAEVRVARWVGVSADVRKANISGVIGAGGISQEFRETDLGGTAFRVRIMVGR